METHVLDFILTLFKSVAMLCETGSILHNIPRIQSGWWFIMLNIVYPTKHCCGFE